MEKNQSTCLSNDFPQIFEKCETPTLFQLSNKLPVLRTVPCYCIDKCKPECFLGGDFPKFLEFCVPHKQYFIAFLGKNFRNLEFYIRQFFSKNFPKFLENFLKFFQLFQNRKKKTIIFVPKLVQN